MTTKIKPSFGENAMKVLCKRYLRPVKEPDKNTDATAFTKAMQNYTDHKCSSCGKHHETPEELIERCSFGNDEFYNLLASLDFLPNSPTLFNAGTGQGTFSACFKFDTWDSLESIMEVAKKGAFVQKWGGGVGYTLSALRPKGAPIKTTHGKACGPIAVMALDQAVAEMITQGGKRDGAQMAILHCDHEDVHEFIHCKDIPEECHCQTCKIVDSCIRSYTKIFNMFNISVAATDEFMQAALIKGNKSYDLFEEIVQSAWKTADPGLFFIDRAERANSTPWLGKITGTNPCGEVPLLDNEPCNLGSINLSHMVEEKNSRGEMYFNFGKLEKTARLATRYLDTVLDNNHFPDPAIDEIARKTRKLGLGVMGWADTLAVLGIPYDSDEAIALGDKIMECIQRSGHLESESLAKERGFCPAFMRGCENNVFEISEANLRPNAPRRRNAAVTCIAPSGTISVLAGCSAGIEPHFTLDGYRAMGDGTRLEEKMHVNSGTFRPKTAHEIDYQWHLKMQAAFQKHTDLAVSKTINMPETATLDDVRSAYIMAWQLGCKGITIYRNNSKFKQVIVTKGQEEHLHTGYQNQNPLTLEVAPPNGHEAYSTDTKFGINRRRMPKTGPAVRHSWKVGESEGYLHIGLFPEDMKPGEIFITESNSGSTIAGLLNTISIVTSLALQYGVPLETLVSKLQHINFEPRGMTANSKIPMASSVVAYIFRFLGEEYLGYGKEKVIEGTHSSTGMFCPDCGAPAIMEETCLVCSAQCGWTRCG